MVSVQQFGVNMSRLKDRMPIKPIVYSSEYPKTLKECLDLYCRQRTVNLLQINTILISKENWPLPFWYNPENWKFGLINRIRLSRWGKKLRKDDNGFGYSSMLVLMNIGKYISMTDIMLEAFDANRKYAFLQLLSNPILESKTSIIRSLERSFKQSNWIACVCTILPLFDFVARKTMGVTNLTKDVRNICKLFEAHGFNIDNADEFMPMMNDVIKRHETGTWTPDARLKELEAFNYGIIGCALSSFVRFANLYYSYFKEDSDIDSSNVLNRHAVLHSANVNFGTKENTVKLITLLFLVLELEPVFQILLTGN